ncbi:hypothetical protein PAEPH01_0914 [Pancytospora epiphaga]|nr:hypothetical protein PAEPH01_0914 [Pancytospora epiphaga]
MLLEQPSEESNSHWQLETGNRKRAVARKRSTECTYKRLAASREMESFYLNKITIYKEEYSEKIGERDLRISELEADLLRVNNETKTAEQTHIRSLEESLATMEESNLELLLTLRSAKTRIKELEIKNDFYRRKIEIFMKESLADEQTPFK